MDGLLSFVTFLPLVAAAILTLFLRGEDAAAQLNAKRLALVATTATFLASLAILLQFDPQNPDFQFVEERDLAGWACPTRWAWMAISDPVRDADHLPDAAGDLPPPGAWTTRVQGIHGRVPRARDADDRRVLCRSI
jgi:hypothetical protein